MAVHIARRFASPLNAHDRFAPSCTRETVAAGAISNAHDEATAPCPTAVDEAAHWVRAHLGDLLGDDGAPSPCIRGGQRAADAALDAFAIRGYAASRNEVWPEARRGASRLSPYIRHGLLTLPRVYDAVSGGPKRDVDRFRDQLLWQEYARHVYARLGARSLRPFRTEPPDATAWPMQEPWPTSMACVGHAREALEREGWLVNQSRMWLASQWTVRAGAAWTDGEQHFFQHLLDGSRAANRLGWQWCVGAATGKPYGFSRWQVEKRAPGLCDSCVHCDDCPIEDWPETSAPAAPSAPQPELGRVGEEATGAGPSTAEHRGEPDCVWLTAESLGDDDPALGAHPDLPAVFVFDEARLARWRLSSKRLVFLAECLADLATRREVEVWRGDPASVLGGRAPAGTFTPVPGWRKIAGELCLAEVHPWPWLRRPHPRAMRSFSAWRKAIAKQAAAANPG